MIFSFFLVMFFYWILTKFGRKCDRLSPRALIMFIVFLGLLSLI